MKIKIIHHKEALPTELTHAAHPKFGHFYEGKTYWVDHEFGQSLVDAGFAICLDEEDKQKAKEKDERATLAKEDAEKAVLKGKK